MNSEEYVRSHVLDPETLQELKTNTKTRTNHVPVGVDFTEMAVDETVKVKKQIITEKGAETIS